MAMYLNKTGRPIAFCCEWAVQNYNHHVHVIFCFLYLHQNIYIFASSALLSLILSLWLGPPWFNYGFHSGTQ